jgi:hypothetical protein
MAWNIPVGAVALEQCHQRIVDQAHATVGSVVAKTVFHVHVVEENGATILRRKIARSDVATFFAKLPTCLIGMEACSRGHHWARLSSSWDARSGSFRHDT